MVLGIQPPEYLIAKICLLVLSYSSTDSFIHATAPGSTATSALHKIQYVVDQPPQTFTFASNLAHQFSPLFWRNPCVRQGEIRHFLSKNTAQSLILVVVFKSKNGSCCEMRVPQPQSSAVLLLTNIPCCCVVSYSESSFSIPFRNFAPSFRLRSPYWTNACM